MLEENETINHIKKENSWSRIFVAFKAYMIPVVPSSLKVALLFYAAKIRDTRISNNIIDFGENHWSKHQCPKNLSSPKLS